MPCCKWWTWKHFLYIGISTLAIGTVLSVLSLVMPYWRTGSGRDEGLYYYCEGGSCSHLGEILAGDEGWWRFCQVLYPPLVLMSVLSLAAGCMFVKQKLNDENVNPKYPNICMVLALIPGVLVNAIQLAYRLGVFRKDLGQSLDFSLYALHATSPLLIIGGTWLRSSHQYGCKKACGPLSGQEKSGIP